MAQYMYVHCIIMLQMETLVHIGQTYYYINMHCLFFIHMVYFEVKIIKLIILCTIYIYWDSAMFLIISSIYIKLKPSIHTFLVVIKLHRLFTTHILCVGNLDWEIINLIQVFTYHSEGRNMCIVIDNWVVNIHGMCTERGIIAN